MTSWQEDERRQQKAKETLRKMLKEVRAAKADPQVLISLMPDPEGGWKFAIQAPNISLDDMILCVSGTLASLITLTHAKKPPGPDQLLRNGK